MQKTSETSLRELLTDTDCLAVGEDGALQIDGCSVADLVARFGAPLFVLSETTFRRNLRRIRAAFARSWPAPVEILYAIKANTSIALRAIAHDEGAGSDCTTLGELRVTFAGGADPRTVSLNGCNKQVEEISEAVQRGALIVIDAEEDIERIAAIAARFDRTARVAIRLKAIDEQYFAAFHSGLLGKESYLDNAQRKKWGVGAKTALGFIERVRASQRLVLEGYHTHLGRWSRDVAMFAANLGRYAAVVADLTRATGFQPLFINIGGGWPRTRDPEEASTELNPHGIEEYARATCDMARRAFEEAGCPLPALWLEPGRFVAGNAGVLLASVGVVKREDGRRWVNLDASNELVPCIALFKQANAVMAATDMRRPIAGVADVVGSICISTRFATDCPLPEMARGDIVAILDAGAYAECMASQFNTLPRPATVLVRDGHAELIRKRESVDEVLAGQMLPPRLRGT